jgi:hypothetical protein
VQNAHRTRSAQVGAGSRARSAQEGPRRTFVVYVFVVVVVLLFVVVFVIVVVVIGAVVVVVVGAVVFNVDGVAFVVVVSSAASSISRLARRWARRSIVFERGHKAHNSRLLGTPNTYVHTYMFVRTRIS